MVPARIFHANDYCARIDWVQTPYIVGITGAVGSGKSTVREWLGARGVARFDADREVHRLLNECPAVVEAVVERFGDEVRSEGGIDRAAVADVVFGDVAAMADLERILHPAVAEAARRWIAGVKADVAAIEAVKLVESGMHEDVDEIWLVTCDVSTRLRRLVDRGWTAPEAERRIGADSELAPRLALADVVIDNSGPREATDRQLESAWSRIVRRQDSDTGA